MTDGQHGKRGAGRHNAAQTRPPEAERPDDERQLPLVGRLGGAEGGPAEQGQGQADDPSAPEDAGIGALSGVNPGLTDLGDDVARGAEEGGSPALPSRGRLEGGIDAGLTDLGDDVARGAEEGGSPALPSRGKLEGGIDAGLTDLGDDGDLPVDLDDDDRPR